MPTYDYQCNGCGHTFELFQQMTDSVKRKCPACNEKKLVKLPSTTPIPIGKNDKIGADQAAVDRMRNQLNCIDMKGRIVIGEGEMDEAPILYINEEIGTKNGDAVSYTHLTLPTILLV